MADNQTELSPMQLAYRAIGLSLWRTRQRALGTNENAPECLFKLMDALAIADEKGSAQGTQGSFPCCNRHPCIPCPPRRLPCALRRRC